MKRATRKLTDGFVALCRPAVSTPPPPAPSSPSWALSPPSKSPAGPPVQLPTPVSPPQGPPAGSPLQYPAAPELPRPGTPSCPASQTLIYSCGSPADALVLSQEVYSQLAALVTAGSCTSSGLTYNCGTYLVGREAYSALASRQCTSSCRPVTPACNPGSPAAAPSVSLTAAAVPAVPAAPAVPLPLPPYQAAGPAKAPSYPCAGFHYTCTYLGCPNVISPELYQAVTSSGSSCIRFSDQVLCVGAQVRLLRIPAPHDFALVLLYCTGAQEWRVLLIPLYNITHGFHLVTMCRIWYHIW